MIYPYPWYCAYCTHRTDFFDFFDSTDHSEDHKKRIRILYSVIFWSEFLRQKQEKHAEVCHVCSGADHSAVRFCPMRHCKLHTWIHSSSNQCEMQCELNTEFQKKESLRKVSSNTLKCYIVFVATAVN